MAIYAIGDLQGCLEPLQQLLEKIHFDTAKDQLWFTGDLVNRGPHSLETLRFVKSLGDSAITVLGNHDLHLLAVDLGHTQFLKQSDTLQAIIDAPDRRELLEWLRQQPLFHHDVENGYSLLHAGLPPQWDLTTTQQCAREVENVLRRDNYKQFIDHMYGNDPIHWSETLQGHDRLRFIVNCFTRLRYCTDDGHLALAAKGAPGSQPHGTRPWFEIENRKSRGMKIIFGHWSTLPLTVNDSIVALDSGCLWGGQLTAFRLDDGQLFQVQCNQGLDPQQF